MNQQKTISLLRDAKVTTGVACWRLSLMLLGFLSVSFAGVSISLAQTDPTAQALPYSFTSQSGSNLLVGMAIHRFGTNAASIPTTRTTLPATSDLIYSATSNAGSWRDEGGNGIGILASGSQAAGAMVVAINTAGKTGIQVSWLCRTILQQASRDNSVALQYRCTNS